MPQVRSQKIDTNPELDSHEVETSPISLGHIMLVLRSYRRVSQLSLLAIIFGYALLALTYYVLSPVATTTRLPFRLEFDGAERGEYPNGLKFSTGEIVSTPIVAKVFAANDLQRYVPFADFKASLYVQEASRELQRLEADYESRLADPKLSPVDRERIEREFDLKKESLRRADFALLMTSKGMLRQIPRDLRDKSLTDILNRWAEVADSEKGALRYRLPLLTTNIVQRSTLGNAEPIIALDILRSRVNRILSNIEQLLTIPGAETVRIGEGKSSLEELRVALEDVRRFQIEPLIARIYERGVISDTRMATAYFETQLGAMQREQQDAELRVTTLQNALNAYMGRTSPAAAAETTTASSTQKRQTSNIAGEQGVVPQVNDSFIDRVVKLVSDNQDKTYRQGLVDRANNEAFQRLMPARKEVEYYSVLVERMRKNPPQTRQNGPDELRAIDASKNASYDDVVRYVQQVSEVYKALSRNLDPDTLLYTRTAPIVTITERSVSGFRLFLLGVVLTLFAIPLILTACLIHARATEERELEIRSDQAVPGS